MKQLILSLTFGIAFSIISSKPALAWGRHDLITQLAVQAPEFEVLKGVRVEPEPIEKAAPDLLKRVMPRVLKWCERYHTEYDRRYSWTAPKRETMEKVVAKSGRHLSDREALLWALEDNIKTPLKLGPEKTAAEILIRYVEEPDGELDGDLNQSPYIERVRDSMGLFYEENNSHTHSFRHYYVPSSLVPPLLSPKGIASYRAGLYSQLAEGAFSTGHPYWGFRFLAWSIHYAQDVTQPWHTVFLPGLSFLKFSKAQMRHEVASLHYLAEAFADVWLHRQIKNEASTPKKIVQIQGRNLANTWEPLPKAANKGWELQKVDPEYVCSLTEKMAQASHDRSLEVAKLSRTFFRPVVDNLGEDLLPNVMSIPIGGQDFNALMLDFGGNGNGATQFLTPVLEAKITNAKERDELLQALVEQVNTGITGTRKIIAHVLTELTLNQQSQNWLCPPA